MGELEHHHQHHFYFNTPPLRNPAPPPPLNQPRPLTPDSLDSIAISSKTKKETYTSHREKSCVIIEIPPPKRNITREL